MATVLTSRIPGPTLATGEQSGVSIRRDIPTIFTSSWTPQTPSGTVPTPSGTASSTPGSSLAVADKIALGVGLSMGLLAAGVGALSVWFAWRQNRWIFLRRVPG